MRASRCGGSTTVWSGCGEPEFAEHIRTDHLPVPQVAERIARSAGLSIGPTTDDPLRGRLRRYATGLRHIRFD